jgi:hypothetical protein
MGASGLRPAFGQIDLSSSTAAVKNQLQISNGGTGASTKSSAFDALSPMSAGGDLIYGGASGTGTVLHNGSSGQLLMSNGSTSPPSWTSVATAMSWSGYQTVTSGCSNGGGTYADPSACSGISLTQTDNQNFPTVSTAGSSLPGVTFTPTATGHVHVMVDVGLGVSSGTSNSSWRLVDGSGTTIDKGHDVLISATGPQSTILQGTYNISSLSTLTFKIQSATNGSSVQIENGTASGSSALMWTITYLH